MSGDRKRLVLVSYLNTLPMLEGIKQGLGDSVEVIQAHPADCARILFEGRADYGLVPVGALAGRKDWRQVSSIGIGCDGLVETVCLFGQAPLPSWERVYLDYQSRTSVLLSRILLRELWRHEIPGFPAEQGYETRTSGREGALIIGDRAISAREAFPFVYDLGEGWKSLTGLPFVFALWVSLRPPDAGFENRLEKALAEGAADPEPVIRAQQQAYGRFDLARYFRQSIRYEISDKMQEGLGEFFRKASAFI